MAGDGITLRWPREDEERLRREMMRLTRELGVTLQRAVVMAAYAVARSVGASTRVAPRYRVVRQVHYSRRSRNRRYAVRFDRLGRDILFWARTKREIQAGPAKIAMRGLARQSWQWGAGRIYRASLPADATQRARQTAARVVDVAISREQNNPYVRITNRLGYIVAAMRDGPKPLDDALRRAAASIAHQLQRRSSK